MYHGKYFLTKDDKSHALRDEQSCSEEVVGLACSL
jgi:hypothetical protein